jgi:hypothetical protein
MSFSTVIAEKKGALNEVFANAVLFSGMPFSAAAGEECKPFSREVFGGAWAPPYRHSISSRYLQAAYIRVSTDVRAGLKKAKALCISVDGISETNSLFEFNVMAGGPIPMLCQTFRLNGDKESAVNVSKQVSDMIEEVYCAVGMKDPSEQIAAVVCSDSPAVIVLTRKMITSTQSGGRKCVLRAYGFSCHALANFSKDLCSIAPLKDVLGKAIQATQLFRNIAIARSMFDKVREIQSPRPQSIKTFSSTLGMESALCCNPCWKIKTALFQL